MVVGIVVILIWFALGVVGIFEEQKDNYIPFFLFIAVVPFFPWILKFCGVI